MESFPANGSHSHARAIHTALRCLRDSDAGRLCSSLLSHSRSDASRNLNLKARWNVGKSRAPAHPRAARLSSAYLTSAFGPRGVRQLFRAWGSTLSLKGWAAATRSCHRPRLAGELGQAAKGK